MRRAWIVSALLCLGLLSGWAVDDDYSPFEAGKRPKAFASVELKPIRGADGGQDWQHYAFTRPKERRVLLRVDVDETGRFSLAMVDADGTLRPLGDLEGGLVSGVQAYEVKLNGDSQPDYLLRTESGGNGLAALINYMTFVVSSPKGYVTRAVLAYGSHVEDLIDIDGDGLPEYLHKMFVYGEAGTDGKVHNYWVYNWLRVDGTKLVSANAKAPGFAKWVWYSFKPNHTDTDQLTAEQRRRLWLTAWHGEASFFPDPDAFADEQGGPKPPPK